MRTWVDVAVLAKTKNLQGGFVVQSAADLPFLLTEGLEVAFVPPALDAPRRARVASVQMSGEKAAMVFFDTVTSIDVAERLAGCHCLVRRADLPADAFLATELVWQDWDVYDATAGFLGTVSGISELPGQSLLEVADVRKSAMNTGDASSDDDGIILIPLVDEFVVSVEEDKQRIQVDIPSGLLDL